MRYKTYWIIRQMKALAAFAGPTPPCFIYRITWSYPFLRAVGFRSIQRVSTRSRSHILMSAHCRWAEITDKRFGGVVGYRICLTHRRSPVRARAESFFSPLLHAVILCRRSTVSSQVLTDFRAFSKFGPRCYYRTRRNPTISNQIISTRVAT